MALWVFVEHKDPSPYLSHFDKTDGVLQYLRKKKININESAIANEEIKPVELKDPLSIRNYVINLCEQMIDISKDMDDLRREYEQVTAHLNDIQIVEGLEGEQKNQLVEIAFKSSILLRK